MMTQEAIIEKIKQAIPDAEVTLRDLTGTSDHWEALVISKQFHGKSKLEQHRVVFDALKEEMSGPIHALTLKTLTP